MAAKCFGLIQRSKDRMSRNFVTMDVLVTERTKDANRSYFGAHNLVGEIGIFSQNFRVVDGRTERRPYHNNWLAAVVRHVTDFLFCLL